MSSWFDDHPLWTFDHARPSRPCAHEGCLGDGLYPALKSRQASRDYQWFCLDHIRAFNEKWNFAEGLDAQDIEALIRLDATWQRPTRPLGDWRKREELMRRKAEFFREGRRFHQSETTHKATPAPSPELAEALDELGLEWPLDDKTLQARYRVLVKEHHPDINQASQTAEDKIKDINVAYNLLRSYLADLKTEA